MPAPSPTLIKDLPLRLRPREKLMHQGKAQLDEKELLAILLGNGTKNLSALGLAAKVMEICRHQLRVLSQIHYRQLAQIPGIGHAKAIKILAALELGRRCMEEKPEPAPAIRSSNDLFQHCKGQFLNLDREIFAIALLNQAHHLLGVEQISEGGLNFTAADPRIILRLALDYRASSLILMHNHPSGNLQPSDADKGLTLKVESAASLLDIRVLDHLIFAQHRYFSFADEGLLPSTPSTNRLKFT